MRCALPRGGHPAPRLASRAMRRAPGCDAVSMPCHAFRHGRDDRLIHRPENIGPRSHKLRHDVLLDERHRSASSGQRPIQRAGCHADLPSDLRHRKLIIGHQRLGDLKLGLIHRFGTAAEPTTSNSGLPPGFTGEALLLDFILSERCQGVDRKPTAGSRAVDSLAQRLQSDVTTGELIDEIENLSDVSSQTIQTKDDHGVAVSGEIEKLGKLWPVRSRAGSRLDKNSLAPRTLKRIDL